MTDNETLNKYIQDIKNKYSELNHKNWDYGSFYNGALEGFGLLYCDIVELEKNNELIKSKLKNSYKVRQEVEDKLLVSSDKIESMKCCGNCDNEDIDYSNNDCRFFGKCKENMKPEFRDKYDSHWKQKTD